MYKIIEDDCIACGTCKESCMFDAIEEVKLGKGYARYKINTSKCFGCGSCKKSCLNECIEEVL